MNIKLLRKLALSGDLQIYPEHPIQAGSRKILIRL
jgi:hypothetical protein